MAGRPWLHVVWDRTFVTEDEADEAYEKFGDGLASPLVVDRFDANTVRVYLNTHALESCAQLIEVAYEPPMTTWICRCGHAAVMHTRDEGVCAMPVCACPGFDRHHTIAQERAE